MVGQFLEALKVNAVCNSDEIDYSQL